MKTWVKVLLSLFIVFHLLAVLVLPNPNSILYRRLPILVEYGNLLAINTTWRFFSPNPLIKTVEYETYEYDDFYDVIKSESHLFPESVSGVGGREAFNRTMNYAMIASSRADWAQELLGPLLCKKHPNADEIAIYQVRNDLMAIEKAQLYENSDLLFEKIKERVTDIQCASLRKGSL